MSREKEREYIVEKILEKKTEKKEIKFRVKWQGYPESESTWEPIAHLAKCLDLIKDFDENQNKTAGKSRSKAQDNKLIGKKRSKAFEDNEDEVSSHSEIIEKKKEESLLKSSSISVKKKEKKESDPGLEKPRSITSSSSEQKKDISLKSPERSDRSERLKHIESVNNEFRDSTLITSPKMITRTMSKGKKTEDDKIIENVFEKLKSPSNFRKESDSVIQDEMIKNLKREGELDCDTAIAILDAKQHKDLDDEILCLIEWAERKDGTKPENSYCLNKDLKKKFPALLCEFYEARLKFPYKKN